MTIAVNTSAVSSERAQLSSSLPRCHAGAEWPIGATVIRCALILLVAMASLARAADPQPYHVELAPTGQAALDSTLKATSQLVELRARPLWTPWV